MLLTTELYINLNGLIWLFFNSLDKGLHLDLSHFFQGPYHESLGL